MGNNDSLIMNTNVLITEHSFPLFSESSIPCIPIRFILLSDCFGIINYNNAYVSEIAMSRQLSSVLRSKPTPTQIWWDEPLSQLKCKIATMKYEWKLQLFGHGNLIKRKHYLKDIRQVDEWVKYSW